MPRRIAVVGATGFVGSHLVPALVALGDSVRATARSRAAAARITAMGGEPIISDVRQPDSMMPLLRHKDGVVNLATITREKRLGDFVAVHIRGVLNLVAACRRARVERVVHIGALGDRRRPSPDDYLALKQLGARALRESGLAATTFNTSTIFGPGDQHLSFIAMSVNIFPLFPMPGRAAASTRFQPIFVGDLVHCIVGALDNPATAGYSFPLGGPHVWRYADLVRSVQRVLGTARPTVHVPPRAMRLIIAGWVR